MIDEKKLIETFEDMALSWGETHDKESKYRRFDMEEIERVVENQPKIGGWIPCSERLPEEYGDYLVTFGFSDINVKSVDVSSYSENGFEFINVIAWQPLPEAYHG